MADEQKTLVAWCNEDRASVDVARAIIRRTPELRQLGTRYGPTRVFTRAEVERIFAAMKNRRSSAKAGRASVAK